MKVKCIKTYNDMRLKKVKYVGDTYEVDDKRAEYLVSQGMVEIVNDEKKPAK